MRARTLHLNDLTTDFQVVVIITISNLLHIKWNGWLFLLCNVHIDSLCNYICLSFIGNWKKRRFSYTCTYYHIFFLKFFIHTHVHALNLAIIEEKYPHVFIYFSGRNLYPYETPRVRSILLSKTTRWSWPFFRLY